MCLWLCVCACASLCASVCVGACPYMYTIKEEVQLQKHELHSHLHKHMELPCVYVNDYVTHENKMP